VIGGSLCLAENVLYVGRQAKTASVTSYDLDGRKLQEHFRFRDSRSGRSSASGLAVDADHRIWVADSAAARLRTFTLFGREVAVLGGESRDREDRAGSLGTPVDVLALGRDEELEIVVASGGERRHAVQRLNVERGRTRSLRSLGDVEGSFQDVVRLAFHDRHLWICERRARRVQVFRDGEFHYAFRVPLARGGFAEPAGIAPLEDGRVAIAVTGETSGVLLTDRSGQLLEVLAEGGEEGGRVQDPCALVLERGSSDRRARIAVLDRGGDRIQLFNLEGRCYGSFAELS
jgi:hypothetical protein